MKERLLSQVARLGTLEGFGDVQVAQSRQGMLATVRPGGLQRMMLSLRGISLMGRANQELRGMSRGIAWGDLDKHAVRVGALDGVSVRSEFARHLVPDRAIAVRIEPNE